MKGLDQLAFKDAPEWVRFAAVQPDGWIRWFEKAPYSFNTSDTYWRSEGIEKISRMVAREAKSIWQFTVTERQDIDLSIFKVEDEASK